MFEAALSDGFDELWYILVGCVFFQGIPYRVVTRGSGVCADGLFYQSFPPVGSVVDSLSDGCITAIFVGSIVGGADDLAGLDTTGRAYDSVIVCKDSVAVFTVARHFYSLSEPMF